MLRILRGRKGQSTAEYAILIGIVIAAVVGMQTWVSRGLKAKIRDASIGENVAGAAGLTWNAQLFNTQQFEPNVPGYSMTNRTAPVREYFDTATNQWVIDIETTGGEITNRVGNQTYIQP